MKEEKDTYLENYIIERHFLNQKKIKDIVKEIVLSKNSQNNNKTLLTDAQHQMYNKSISM